MNKDKYIYKYLTLLTLLYMTIKLSTILLIYKIIKIGIFTASASTLVMPFWFFIGNIIAEVYGYKIARHLIWMSVFCQFLFSFGCASLIKFQSPMYWPYQAAYDQVLGNLPRVAIASFCAITVGAFINAYAITKWKMLLKGKYFWLRNIGASSIGELIFTILAYIMEFLYIVPWHNIMQLIIISFTIKLIFSIILITPALICVNVLKKLENIDFYDYNTNFNPFKVNLEDK